MPKELLGVTEVLNRGEEGLSDLGSTTESKIQLFSAFCEARESSKKQSIGIRHAV